MRITLFWLLFFFLSPLAMAASDYECISICGSDCVKRSNGVAEKYFCQPKAEHACYEKFSKCEKDDMTKGCKWNPTPEFFECMKNPPPLTTGSDVLPYIPRCVRAGCRGQFCVDERMASNLGSDCNYSAVDECYKLHGVCTVRYIDYSKSNVCVWTENAQLQSCVQKAREKSDKE